MAFPASGNAAPADGNSWSGFGEVMTPDTYMATVSGATGTQLLARDFRVNLPSEQASSASTSKSMAGPARWP